MDIWLWLKYELNFHFLYIINTVQYNIIINFQLTWADVYFAGILDYMNYMVKRDLLENYPALRGVVDAVNGLEPIKAWIEKRPQTEV